MGRAGYPTWVITLRCLGVEELGFRPRMDIGLQKFTQKVDNPIDKLNLIRYIIYRNSEVNMFDRNNRPKLGNVLKISKGFVKSVNESWAMLSKTEQTIAERNGIHFFHDGDMFVVTPSNPSQYDDDFVCSLVCVGKKIGRASCRERV